MTEHEIIIANSTKRVLTYSSILLNTQYTDNIIQFILTEEELFAAGVLPGMEITSISFMPGTALPAYDLTDFRVKMGPIEGDTVEFNTFMTTLQLVYGPYTIPRASLVLDTWYNLTLDIPFKYRGGGNIAIEMSRDRVSGYSYIGGMYAYSVPLSALRGTVAGWRSTTVTYNQYYTGLLNYIETIDYIPALKVTAQPFIDIIQTQDINILTNCTDIHAASGVTGIQENFACGLPDYFIFDRLGYKISNEFAYLGMPTVLAFRKINEADHAIVQLFLYYTTTGTISFKRKIFTETNYDFYKFSIDGTEKVKTSGNIDWTAENYVVVPGLHEFKWETTADNYMCATKIWLANITAIGADPTRAAVQQIRAKTDCMDELHYTGREYYDIHIDPSNPFNTNYYVDDYYKAAAVSVVDVHDWKFGDTKAFKLQQTDYYSDGYVYFNIPVEQLGPGKFSCYVQMNRYWYATYIDFILETEAGYWNYVIELDGYSMSSDMADTGEVPDHSKWFRIEIDVPTGLQQIIVYAQLYNSEGYCEDDGCIYIADMHITNANPDVYRQVIVINEGLTATEVYTTPYRSQIVKVVNAIISGSEVYTSSTRPQVVLVKIAVISETYYTPKAEQIILTTTGVLNEIQFKVVNEQTIRPVIRATSVFQSIVPSLPFMGVTLDNLNAASAAAVSLSTNPNFYFGNFVTCIDGSILICFRDGLDIKINRIESETVLFTTPNIVEQGAWTVYTLHDVHNWDWCEHPEYCYLQVLDNKEIILYILDITLTTVIANGMDLYTYDLLAYASSNGIGDDFSYRARIGQLIENKNLWGPLDSGAMISNPIQLDNGRIGFIWNYVREEVLLGQSDFAFCFSDDDGHSWNHVHLPKEAIRIFNSVGLAQVDGTLMVIPWLQAIGSSGCILMISHDNGNSWSQYPGSLWEWDINVDVFDGKGDGYTYMMFDGMIYFHPVDVPPYTNSCFNEYGTGKYWEPLIGVNTAFGGDTPHKLIISPDTFNIAVCSKSRIFAFNRNIQGKLVNVQEIYVITDQGLKRVLEAYAITESGLVPIQFTNLIMPK